MQFFVYPHRKTSEDAIFGDLVTERWDQHDQSITMGNVKRSMKNCDMLIKKCTHKLWCGGAPSCWKNTAGCTPCNYTWIKVFQHIQVTGRCQLLCHDSNIMQQGTPHINFGVVSNASHCSVTVFRPANMNISFVYFS